MSKLNDANKPADIETNLELKKGIVNLLELSSELRYEIYENAH